MSIVPTRLIRDRDVIEAAIFLCDLTGRAAESWAEAGVRCYCVDIQHSQRVDRTEGNIRFVWGDARSWCPPAGLNIIFVAAFPPCTHLAGSGSRDWLKKGHHLLSDSLEIWSGCLHAAEWSRAPYLIENPVGAISRHMRKPDLTFDPWEYAGYLPDIEEENTKKKTHLWTGGGFIMPSPRPAPPPHRQDVWRAAPSDGRADLRSASPRGFFRAVFEANAPEHLRRKAA
jgi:hypothetical protein